MRPRRRDWFLALSYWQRPAHISILNRIVQSRPILIFLPQRKPGEDPELSYRRLSAKNTKTVARAFFRATSFNRPRLFSFKRQASFQIRQGSPPAPAPATREGAYGHEAKSQHYHSRRRPGKARGEEVPPSSEGDPSPFPQWAPVGALMRPSSSVRKRPRRRSIVASN